MKKPSMNIFKKILSTVGHLLLSIVRVLRRAVCCRKKKDDFILPMTIDQVNNSESQKVNDMYDLQPHWDAWPEVGNSSSSPNASGAHDKLQGQIFHQEENIDDFFKDMVPQIRKPKKLYIRTDEVTEETYSSNRLAMDPKAILSGPDLGIIEDNPSNWEDIEDSGELWDADELIRETKRAEREKRLAEHQRRKQERESRRARQDSSSNSAILNLSDSRDKAKSS